jgi:hypothetical protein
MSHIRSKWLLNLHLCLSSLIYREEDRCPPVFGPLLNAVDMKTDRDEASLKVRYASDQVYYYSLVTTTIWQDLSQFLN